MSLMVNDISIAQIRRGQYDAALFSSGYEARCVHAPAQFESTCILSVTVLGFAQLSESELRKSNDDYFRTKWNKEPVLVGASDDGAVYEMLRAIGASGRRNIRILVDYSSMSRIWYSAVINWARFVPNVESVEIDFVYSLGDYEPGLVPIVINDMLAIPGCEGGSLRFSKSVAVFGLGFYGMMADCVMEHLEPDIVFAFLASPGSSPEHVEQVKRSNEFLLSQADSVLEVPLCSVEASVRYLTELVLPELAQSEVVLIPMGPKPHVLACVLLAMRFGDITCLRVSAKRDKIEQVPASGPILATRVRMEK